MTDRTRPYIDETYPEMMQRLREALPPEESMATRVQRWRQSSDESLKLLNFFGDNINIGNSENYLRYTTAKGIELSGDLTVISGGGVTIKGGGGIDIKAGGDIILIGPAIPPRWLRPPQVVRGLLNQRRQASQHSESVGLGLLSLYLSHS